MRTKLITLLYFSILGIFLSCNKQKQISISHIDKYFELLNNEENGLIKSRSANGYEIKVKYLPIDYLIYKNHKDNLNENNLDTLKSKYKNALAFIMTIGLKDDAKDIMYSDIDSYKEYASRLQDLNFSVDQKLNLLINKVQYTPVSTNFENTYGLRNSRDIFVVYNIPDREIRPNGILDFIYDDQWFETGKNHFRFSTNDILNFPTIKFK
jgi:hypothetical protein